MNQAEIMTLLSNKVPAATIRICIMAGKLSGILGNADRLVAQASNFKDKAKWTEILTLLEGQLEEKTDYQAQDDYSHSKGR